MYARGHTPLKQIRFDVFPRDRCAAVGIEPRSLTPNLHRHPSQRIQPHLEQLHASTLSNTITELPVSDVMFPPLLLVRTTAKKDSTKQNLTLLRTKRSEWPYLSKQSSCQMGAANELHDGV